MLITFYNSFGLFKFLLIPRSILRRPWQMLVWRSQEQPWCLVFSTPPLTNTTYPFLVNLSTGLVFGESPILLITVSLVSLIETWEREMFAWVEVMRWPRSLGNIKIKYLSGNCLKYSDGWRWLNKHQSIVGVRTWYWFRQRQPSAFRREKKWQLILKA